MPVIAQRFLRRTGPILTLAVLWAAIWSPAALAQEDKSKEQVAVMDLEVVGATAVQASALTDRLREEILKTGRFTLVNRSQLEAVIEEQALQQTTCTGQDCALAVGRLLGVKKIITGKATRLEGNLWQVSALLIDVETAETLRAESVVHEGRFVDLIRTGMTDLAQKLVGEEKLRGAVTPSVVVPPPVAEPALPPEPEEEPLAADVVPLTPRVLFSPLTPFAMTVELDFPTGSVTETITGVGISLGVDFIFDEAVAVWGLLHTGTLDSVEAEDDDTGETATLEGLDGSFTMIAIGVSGVIKNGPFTILLGGGIFTAEAVFTGSVLLTDGTVVLIDSDVTVSGILFDGRFDYTFSNGVFIGAGIDIGFGSASGTETTGADSASGSVVVIYFPVGFTF